jgi:hypothetical protein
MAELFARVQDIQRKAADSEVLVQEICRDIRKVRAERAVCWRAVHVLCCAGPAAAAPPARAC